MTLACCRQIYSSFPVIRPGGLRAACISFTSTFGVARHVVPSASSVIRVTNTGQPTAVRSSGPVVTSSLINQPSANQPINQSISQHSVSNQQSVIHQSSITVGLGRLPARGSTRRRAARALPPLPRHQSCNAARRAGPYLRGLSRQHSVLLVESPQILRVQSFCACVEVKGNGFRLPPPRKNSNIQVATCSEERPVLSLQLRTVPPGNNCCLTGLALPRLKSRSGLNTASQLLSLRVRIFPRPLLLAPRRWLRLNTVSQATSTG